jgi:hypothetical protein
MPEKGIFSRNFFFIEYFGSILFHIVFSILDSLLPEEKSKFKSKIKKLNFLTCKNA